MSYCVAYDRLCAASVALGRPMIAAEVARIIETDPACQAAFVAINAELGAGAVLTDEDIATRVCMPVAFVRSLITALRGDEAGERPARVN